MRLQKPHVVLVALVMLPGGCSQGVDEDSQATRQDEDQQIVQLQETVAQLRSEIQALKIRNAESLPEPLPETAVRPTPPEAEIQTPNWPGPAPTGQPVPPEISDPGPQGFGAPELYPPPEYSQYIDPRAQSWAGPPPPAYAIPPGQPYTHYGYHAPRTPVEFAGPSCLTDFGIFIDIPWWHGAGGHHSGRHYGHGKGNGHHRKRKH